MMRRALLILFLLTSSLANSVEESISIMTDGRNWIPLDILLPYGQSDVWLMPEGESIRRKEFLIVKEEPPSVQLKNLSPILVDSTKSKELVKEKTKNGNLLVFISGNNRFVANFSMQGNKRVHHIRYVAPVSAVSKDAQTLWINRLKQSTTTDEQKNSLTGIIVKADGVYKQSKKLQPNSSWHTYKHPQLKFAVDLPSTWGFIDDAKKKVSSKVDPGFYTHLVFNRLDKLATGLVAHIQHDTTKSKQESDQEWAASVEIIAQENEYEIINHGEIQNKQGRSGNYLILMNKQTKEKSLKALYPIGDKTYKIECSCHANNFDLLYPYFHRILVSFSL